MTGIEKLAKTNFFRSTDINDIKKLSLCTTRQDLCIEDITQVKWFSPREYQNRENWKYGDFGYVISELGLRGDKIPDQIDLAAFGCSFTFGQGLSTEMLWHDILAKEKNYTSYNFGLPAASIPGLLYMFSLMSNISKIKNAVFLLPPYHRIPIAAKSKHTDDIELVPLIPNYSSNLEENFNLDGKAIYGSIPDEELYRNFKDTLYLIETIAESKGVNVYFSSWDHPTYLFMQQMNFTSVLLPEWNSEWHPDYEEDLTKDIARDNLHPGPRHHIKWANKIKDYIK
jgi:hypothetical protein